MKKQTVTEMTVNKVIKNQKENEMKAYIEMKIKNLQEDLEDENKLYEQKYRSIAYDIGEKCKLCTIPLYRIADLQTDLNFLNQYKTRIDELEILLKEYQHLKYVISLNKEGK
jgi:hypothetical protein